MRPGVSGNHSEVGDLKRVLVKRPEQAFVSQGKLEAEWRNLGYRGCPDFRKAVVEYEAFLSVLASHAEPVFCPHDDSATIDSIYVRDASILTHQGMVLCNMGKAERAAEPSALMKEFARAEIPMLGAIRAPGLMEGGDAVWLDEYTLAVGRGYRTNSQGIDQLKRMLAPSGCDVAIVDLPHWNGPGDVFHLMSILSPVDTDKALVYSRLLPVVFRTRLLELNYRLIEVPDEEFESMGCNVLALAPGKVLALSGNPLTRRLLEQAGVEVLEYRGEEISRKGLGGPTCLTRPLLRASVAGN
jgi:N-dimethylarginine dimethylaminohydrolase